MKLHINGEERDFAEGFTLASLVDHLGMKADRVAVELNREIVARERWPETRLNSGDRLEIVHFVGGGLTSCPFSINIPTPVFHIDRSQLMPKMFQTFATIIVLHRKGGWIVLSHPERWSR